LFLVAAVRVHAPDLHHPSRGAALLRHDADLRSLVLVAAADGQPFAIQRKTVVVAAPDGVPRSWNWRLQHLVDTLELDLTICLTRFVAYFPA
jgi:hypothetical protein